MQAIDRLAERLFARRRLPNATYRLQFNPKFTFTDARAIVHYLYDLGISEAYASPIFTAREGSTHGYDVCDYGQLSPVLGGAAAFALLSDVLREHRLGLILDMVPNHMGIGNGNAWWMDVLEHGPASPYAAFFDIDWEPVKPQLAGKVLLPILGDQYGVVLENGELQVHLHEGSFVLRYYETWLPLAPRSTLSIFEMMREQIVDALPEDDAQRQEFESIITALNYLPNRDETDPERLAELRRESAVIKRRFSALFEASSALRLATATALQALNGTVGEPRSFDNLDTLINAQPYRLAFWRVAAEEINYRRFFDINDLAAVRVELPEVFEKTHELVFRLVTSGVVSGLRIDHPDGLWDPPGYFRQLQERYLLEQLRASGDEFDEESAAQQIQLWALQHAARRAQGEGRWPLYVVVAEKILSESEPLPPDWAVDGTTGYDFLNLSNGLFVDSANEEMLDTIYRRFVLPPHPARLPTFSAYVHQAKQEIMSGALASEITSFSHQLERINEKNRRYRDFTLRGLTDALTAIIAEMSIYRTYITDPESVSERDVRYVLDAVRAARRLHPRIPRSLISFLRDTMLLRNLHEFRAEDRQDVIDVVMRLQQITGPVMAKSVEDTAFYRYHRLVALNEVGGHPDQFGLPVAEFHHQNTERQRVWPHAMLSSSTHDTKRSEDVRARLNVLSELPDEWRAAVNRWSARHAAFKAEGEAERWPDRASEYLLYQSLVGAWPFSSEEHRAQSIEHRTENQESRTENREPRTENRELRTENRELRTENLGIWEPENREPRTENREPRTENRELRTENRELRTENREPRTESAEQRAQSAQGGVALGEGELASFRERITAYMQKATREAKLYTSWLNPNEVYDTAMSDFVAAVLDPANPCLTEIATFARRISFFGQINSLAQTTLKLTAPGVPDIYQGTELWDFSLVDPDNRRPVDYALRQRYLAELDAHGEASAALAEELLAQHDDGRIKLYLISRLLRYRRQQPLLFAEGSYRALESSGERAEHVVAFVRSLKSQQLVVAVPRLPTRLTAGEARMPLGKASWGETRLLLPEDSATARWRNLLTGESSEGLRLAEVFARLPVAVLVREVDVGACGT